MNLARIRFELTEDAVEERRLAGAVRPDQAENLALVHIEGHAPDGLDAPEALLNTADRKDWLAHLSCASCWRSARATGRAMNRSRMRPQMPIMPDGTKMSMTITSTA